MVQFNESMDLMRVNCRIEIRKVTLPYFLFPFVLISWTHLRAATTTVTLVATVFYSFIDNVDSRNNYSPSNEKFTKLFKFHENTSLLYYKIKTKLSKL